MALEGGEVGGEQKLRQHHSLGNTGVAHHVVLILIAFLCNRSLLNKIKFRFSHNLKSTVYIDD